MNKNKTNFFIIHGAYGNPNENWFPWLKNELEKMGYEVFAPQFPTPEGQELDRWLNTFKNYKEYLNKNSIVIGHSLGAPFLLSIIERLGGPIKAAFLVAGWTGLLDDDLDKINYSFTDKDFDWKKIRENCKKFYAFCSDNDPYVTKEKTERMAKILSAELIFVKNAGHFNAKAGYIKFPLLLEKIKEVIE